ncbi:uncharacterized protein LOC144164233 isoform X2 [Haemaphysalis longicornis]
MEDQRHRIPPQSAMLGIGMATAALTANLMGLGIATMPLAFAGIGWSAIFLTLLFGALAAFNSLLLGWSCDILEERHEEFRKFHWYTQYTDIASKAFGPLGRKVVVALRLLSVVGLQAVLLVTMAEHGCDLVLYVFSTGRGIPPCMFCGLLAGMGILFAIAPVGFKTRYWSNIGYLPFHLVLLVLLIAGLATIKGIPYYFPGIAKRFTQPISGASFFGGLGILAFNYANIAGFTLVRRDMRAPTDFSKAAVGSVADFLCCCLKRISPPMLLACLLGLAVPLRGPLMALVGSLVVCPIIYMLPPIFYFKLCKGSDQWPEKPLSNLIKPALAISLFAGLLVALGGSYSAIAEIVYESQVATRSCYHGFCYIG